MKNMALMITISLLVGYSNAYGSLEKFQNLSVEQQKEVLSALQLLADSGVITSSDENGIGMDTDLVSELSQLGLLKHGDSRIQVICVGPLQNR